MPVDLDRAIAAHTAKRAFVQSVGGGGGGFGDAGPPTWNLAAWDAFRAHFGEDPWTREHLPPDLENAPSYIHERLGLRPPMTAR